MRRRNIKDRGIGFVARRARNDGIDARSHADVIQGPVQGIGRQRHRVRECRHRSVTVRERDGHRAAMVPSLRRSDRCPVDVPLPASDHQLASLPEHELGKRFHDIQGGLCGKSRRCGDDPCTTGIHWIDVREHTSLRRRWQQVGLSSRRDRHHSRVARRQGHVDLPRHIT